MASLRCRLRALKLVRSGAAALLLFLVVMFILPNYSLTDSSSLSVVKENSTAQADVSGYSVSYVESHGKDYDPNAEEFVATHEWQQIKQGQSIPRGLHVRMNFQTGIKEAKLMPSKKTERVQSEEGLENFEKAMNDLKKDIAEQKQAAKAVEREEGATFTKEELKAALKNFHLERETEAADEKADEFVKNKYRSIEDLKDDMKKWNADFKTDAQVLKELLQVYRNASLSIEHRLRLLQDLAYYAHQVDNGRDLIELGGLQLVANDLQHATMEVRAEAAGVLGSASQSNPAVQVHLLKLGVLSKLLQLLEHETSSTVRSRSLHALSSLLRHFPHAQQAFLQQGGLRVLSHLLTQQGTHKLQVKVVTLLNDLALEKKLHLQHSEDDAQQQEKVKQYRLVLLEEGVHSENFCRRIPSLLQLHSNHDTREKVLVAMTTLYDTCSEQWGSSVATLRVLRNEYDRLALEEREEQQGDHYFGDLLRTADDLLARLSATHCEL